MRAHQDVDEKLMFIPVRRRPTVRGERVEPSKYVAFEYGTNTARDAADEPNQRQGLVQARREMHQLMKTRSSVYQGLALGQLASAVL